MEEVLHLVDFLWLHEQNVLGLRYLVSTQFKDMQVLGDFDVILVHEANVKHL